MLARLARKLAPVGCGNASCPCESVRALVADDLREVA